VGITAKELLRQERCLVLWLAPTTQIVEQTLKALRDKRHPYRQALDDAFAGCVSVMDLGAAMGLSQAVLVSDTIVIVSTLAAMRVENTEGRKIYEANGQLMACFGAVTKEQLAALGPANGTDPTVPSLANLLRLHRPLVIVDEAHNARTHLSFDTLARFNPSCILEFTATPDQDPKGDPSNVLVHVSAADLKTEHMIKLPIRLQTLPEWKQAVQAAVDKQAELQRLANEDEKAGGQYVRPIVLFQAQRNVEGQKNVTFDVLKASLVADFNIPEDEIAIATGTVNDLADLNVLERGQKVRYIITVDKLREGWDCPFAYILCTAGNLTKSSAVEQILGRILRMPYAQERGRAELNAAYAYATSQGFTDAANALTEALVETGFERFEAQAMVQPETRPLDFGPLFGQPVSEPVSAAPSLEGLPPQLLAKITVAPRETGALVTYSGPAMSEPETEALKAAVACPEDREAMERLGRKSRGEDASPAAMGKPFSVPGLAVRVGDQLEFFEDQFLEEELSLGDCDPRVTEAEFAIPTGPSRVAVVDADEQGRIYYFVEQLERQLSLLDVRGPKTPTELAVWLDREIEHRDITHAEAGLFMRKMIQRLMEDRGIAIEQLVTNRFRLRDAAREKISSHRLQANGSAFQKMLLPECATPLEVGPEKCFSYPRDAYPAPRLYDGPRAFSKHYYSGPPAEMNGEEAACAAIIDIRAEVRYWVRNLEREGYAFWLPTSTDKFYPDFVALLKDGRYLAVEYKGEHLIKTPDTLEKRLVGDLWQGLSKGRCLFRLVGKATMEGEIVTAVAPPTKKPN
jgi:type III restriction enzyme